MKKNRKRYGVILDENLMNKVKELSPSERSLSITLEFIIAKGLESYGITTDNSKSVPIINTPTKTNNSANNETLEEVSTTFNKDITIDTNFSNRNKNPFE